MAIELGQEQVTIVKQLSLVSVSINRLSSPGNQEIVIQYVLNEEMKQIFITGYELYDFYMNKWSDGRAIINKIKEVEGLNIEDVDVIVAENQFVEGLPTEININKPVE